MKKGFSTILLACLFWSNQLSFGQTNKEKAQEKGTEAVKLMDKGEIKESLKLLEEAQKLDPERLDFAYEMAYANYLNKDYKEAIKILEKNTEHKDVNDRLFQLLGNCQDVLGKSDKALEAYDAGLKKFPDSGRLYLEIGNVYWGKKEFNKTIPYYEKGIEVDPKFASNYYRAARVFCGSTEEIWGLIYGEIFINLEMGSKRTGEISKMLYETYKSEIKFTSDSSMTVSFCQQTSINASDLSDPKKFKLPFCMVVEPTLMMAIATEKSVDLQSLANIRKRFIDVYYQMGHNVTYPNILYDYHKKIIDAGHWEAYNYWIFIMGDEAGFTAWKSTNKEKWDAFVKWYSENTIKISADNKFYRGQY